MESLFFNLLASIFGALGFAIGVNSFIHLTKFNGDVSSVLFWLVGYLLSGAYTLWQLHLCEKLNHNHLGSD